MIRMEHLNIIYYADMKRVKHNILEKTRVIRKLSIYDSILKLAVLVSMPFYHRTRCADDPIGRFHLSFHFIKLSIVCAL